MGLFYVLGRLINDLVSRRWYCDEVIVRLVDSYCIRSTSSMIAMSPIRMTRLYEAASSTFDFVSSTLWCEQRTSLARQHHNWQRTECGWNYVNLRRHRSTFVDQLIMTGHMLTVWAWMLVHELHEEQEWIYIHDVGSFCFVSMKQRLSKRAYTLMCMPMIRKNTGHNEVISFDSLWIADARGRLVCSTWGERDIDMLTTKLSDWSCRWLSFVLKIKPCMSKYELV